MPVRAAGLSASLSITVHRDDAEPHPPGHAAQLRRHIRPALPPLHPYRAACKSRQRPAQQSGRKPAATGGRKPGAPGGAKGKAGTTAKTGAPARGQAKASGGAKPQGTGARGSKQGTTHVNGGAPKRSGADLRPGRAHRAAVAAKRSGGKRRG